MEWLYDDGDLIILVVME